METEAIPTKTFKEVHAELERESVFLSKKHDLSDFSKKGSFLQESGFVNSIATRLYNAVASSSGSVAEHQRKYGGQYKMLLEPQLERVCEKYNLFVRDVEFFIADIPEKNVLDIMNFKIHITDVKPFYYWVDEKKDVDHTWHKERDWATLSEIRSREKYLNWARNRYSTFNLTSIIEIAAIKNLFSESAFEKSTDRIIKEKKIEAVAKGQVDLDPIVLVKTYNGYYIVVTAWGDEANDELVLNQNHN